MLTSILNNIPIVNAWSYFCSLPTKNKYNKGHIVIPYTQGLGDSIKKICRKYGIHAHFKGNRTIKEILVKPKGKDPLDRKSGAIY